MTDKPQNVHIALPSDEEGLFPILMMAHEESAVMPLSEARVHEIITTSTRRKGGVIGLIRGGERIEGVLCLRLARMPYSDEWHLEDIANYVHPLHRKSNHAKNLIQFGHWMAEQMGFPLLIGILSAKRLESKRKFYQRYAGKEVGSVYIHNPIHGAFMELA